MSKERGKAASLRGSPMGCGKPEPASSKTQIAPFATSAAGIERRLDQMLTRREWSSGFYSVRVDELRELVAILKAILKLRLTRLTKGKPRNDSDRRMEPSKKRNGGTHRS